MDGRPPNKRKERKNRNSMSWKNMTRKRRHEGWHKGSGGGRADGRKIKNKDPARKRTIKKNRDQKRSEDKMRTP
jgi:hypothetical protein